MEKKKLGINLTIPKNQTIGAFIEKIIFEYRNELKELILLTDIKPLNSSINSKITILNERNIRPQEELIIHTQIIQIGENKRKNISREYEIKNEEGEIILKKQDYICLEDIQEEIKSFKISKETKPGLYFITLTLKDKEKIIIASNSFKIDKRNDYFLPFSLQSQFSL